MARAPVDPEALNEVMWQFAGPVVVATASETGVLARLARAPATAEQVAEDLGLEPLATGKVVRALHALGLVEARGDEYAIAAPLAGCFGAGPDDMSPYLAHLAYLNKRWADGLGLWLRGEEPPRGPMTPEAAAAFSAAMVAMGRTVAARLGEILDLTGVNRMLDVGGGFGHYAQALCRRKPDLTAVVLDRPVVVDQGREALAASQIADRIQLVGGDYLDGDAYGSGFDLVLLANVLHQEPAEHAARLVANAAAALVPGGRVAVVDFAIDDEQREHFMGVMFAINMRSFGDTYTEPTICGWLADAGLVDIARTDLSSLRWLFTGRKP